MKYIAHVTCSTRDMCHQFHVASDAQVTHTISSMSCQTHKWQVPSVACRVRRTSDMCHQFNVVSDTQVTCAISSINVVSDTQVTRAISSMSCQTHK